MLEGLSTRYGWAPSSDMKELPKKKQEDMLWLWCMHSMWTSADCEHLLATTCRAGWKHKTNGGRFGKLSWYTNGQRPDLVCFLGPVGRPNHAVFCELAIDEKLPAHPEKHKDYGKVTSLSPWLPVNYVLIDGTLSTEAEPTQTTVITPRNEIVEYLVITPDRGC